MYLCRLIGFKPEEGKQDISRVLSPVVLEKERANHVMGTW